MSVPFSSEGSLTKVITKQLVKGMVFVMNEVWAETLTMGGQCSGLSSTALSTKKLFWASISRKSKRGSSFEPLKTQWTEVLSAKTFFTE